MKTRDFYAAAALQGLIANPRAEEDICVQDVWAEAAADFADELAKVACKRWGHDYCDGTCERCGAREESSR